MEIPPDQDPSGIILVAIMIVGLLIIIPNTPEDEDDIDESKKE